MNERIRIGIVGAGGRGVNAFAQDIVLRHDTELVAFCDPNPVRMEEAAKHLKKEIAFHSSVAEMIRAEKPSTVIITSPDCCHEANAVEALENGVHVLIDKPLSTTVRGCRNIIEAAERNGKIAMIGFNLRHNAVLMRLKELIAEGRIGEIFLIENREFYNGGRSYMARWNRFYECSGGLWVHKGSHDFDVFQWLLDFPKPRKVSSFAGVSVFDANHLPFPLKEGVKAGPTCGECAYAPECPDRYEVSGRNGEAWGKRASACDGYVHGVCLYASEKDTHDNGIAMVEYENGVRASHLECFATPLTDRLYTVVGTLGQIEASLTERTVTLRPRWKGDTLTWRFPEDDGGHGGADPKLIDTFLKTLRGELENSSTLEHGMWATAAGQAAEIARRENRVVMVEELFDIK